MHQPHNAWVEPYDLFVSYAHDDGWQLIEPLVEYIKQKHLEFSPAGPLEVFFDKRSIPTGRFWEVEIRTGLRQSKMFLAVISPNYLRADMPGRPNWCRREWDEFIRLESSRQFQQGVWPGEAVVPMFIIAPKDIEQSLPDSSRKWWAQMQQRQGVDRRLHFAADALLNVLAHCLPLRQV